MRPSESEPRAAASLADNASELQQTLFRVNRALVFRNPPNSPLVDLPVSQVRCLHAISGTGAPRMQELADCLDMKLPAMSQIVDRLVKRGMVERHADPDDRRVVRLKLTEKARAQLDAARAARQVRLAATLRCLDAGGMAKVLEGLRLLAGAAERAQAERAPEERAQDEEQDEEMPRPAVSLSPDADPVVEMLARRMRRGRAASRGAMRPDGAVSTAPADV